jgi:23S rRNA (adenine2503-C2)-methyltransferase
MPVNRVYPIEKVVAAAREFLKATGGPLTFEYVVVPGENDGREAVRALVKLLHGIRCKVNCIPYNRIPGDSRSSPSFDEVRRFADALHGRGMTATVRKSRGHDIQGACGQLCGRGSRTLSP